MLKKYTNMQQDINNIKEFKARFGAGTRSTQVKSRVKAMEKMLTQGLDKPTLESTFSFRFSAATKAEGALISFFDAGFAYPGGEKLFTGLDFGIHAESRIALVGPNGVGKSTLLKLIDGNLEPTEGSITRSPHIRISRFHQHFVEQLDMNQSAISFIETEFGEPIEKVRA